MIMTVSLNPAVDRTCRIREMAAGEVNRMDSAQSIAGGKAINVTRVLRLFHIPVAAVGFLGGFGGDLIEKETEKMGAECHFTRIAQETRINTNLLEQSGRVTELLEPGPVISHQELETFLKQFAGCLEFCTMTVLSGSLPRGVPADLYAVLIKMCHMAGHQVILDSSGEALWEGIKAGPDLVKPNRRELETLAGRTLETREKLEAAAGELLTLGVGKAVISLGREGLLCVEKDRTTYREAVKVKAVNTVSCGDTVVASLCMSRLAGEDTETALKKAAALAAANAMTRENGDISMETYLHFL